MSRLLLFFAAVIIGVMGTIVLSNQNQNKKPPVIEQNLKASISPPSTNPDEKVSKTENKEVSAAIIKTSKGNIVVTLYSKDAPKTVENFVNKSKSGFYNNLTFHRVEDWVIQGGDPKGNGTGGGDMPTELNSKPFVVGSLGVARGQDIKISNDSQFFITKKESSFLNNQYTNFGIVIKGMDVVNKMQIGDKILGITFN